MINLIESKYTAENIAEYCWHNDCSAIVRLSDGKYACVGLGERKETLLSVWADTYLRFGDWEEGVPEDMREEVQTRLAGNVIFDFNGKTAGQPEIFDL